MTSKVLFVIFDLGGGGAERQLLGLLRRLDRRRFEPHLAVFALTGRERELLPPDVALHAIDTRGRPRSLFLVPQLARLIAALRPDRILSFLWSVNLITIAAASLCRRAPRVIASERTYLGLSIARYPLIAVRRRLLRWLYPQAGTITAVSRAVADNLVEEFGVPRERIVVIHNGVDVAALGELMREPPAPAVPASYILGAGGLNPTKNFALLLQAFALLRDETGLMLVILGDGPERPALERLAGELGLGGRVLLPGAVDNPFAFMARARLFVLCSRFEGFPNVILEAMACGAPVVATASPSGIQEVVEHGVTGLLAPPDDPDALAAAMRLLLADAPLRARCVENARRVVSDAFTLESVVRRYERLLA